VQYALKAKEKNYANFIHIFRKAFNLSFSRNGIITINCKKLANKTDSGSIVAPKLSALPKASRDGWPWQLPDQRMHYDERKNWPTISVIVPSYQQGHFIEETLRSIILQEYPAIEIIVVDGGSTDQTTSILKAYDPWITKWVSEKDDGQSHALNKGISWATGDYIGWQNSDDFYYHGALKALAISALQGHDVVYANLKIIDEYSAEISRLYFLPFHGWLLKYYGIVFSNQAALYRTSLLKALGINESYHYAMDFDLEFRLWKAGAKFGTVNKFLGAFRYHSNAKTVREFHHKVKQEEQLVRSQHGMPIDNEKTIEKQYPLRYMFCIVYVLFQRLIRGGLWYKIKKTIGLERKLYRKN